MREWHIEFTEGDWKNDVRLIDVEKFLIKYGNKTPKDIIRIIDFVVDHCAMKVYMKNFKDQNEYLDVSKDLYQAYMLKEELNELFAEEFYGNILKRVRDKKEKEKDDL